MTLNVSISNKKAKRQKKKKKKKRLKGLIKHLYYPRDEAIFLPLQFLNYH